MDNSKVKALLEKFSGRAPREQDLVWKAARENQSGIELVTIGQRGAVHADNEWIYPVVGIVRNGPFAAGTCAKVGRKINLEWHVPRDTQREAMEYANSACEEWMNYRRDDLELARNGLPVRGR